MLKLLLLFWWNESCIYFSPFPLPFFPFFVSAKSMCSGWANLGEAFAHWLAAQWELCSSCVGAHSGSCVFWKNPHSGSCVQVGNLKLGSLKLGESKCFMILQNMMLEKLKAKPLWWFLRTLHSFKKKKTINMRFSDSLILTVSPLAGRHCGCVRHRHRDSGTLS